MTRISLLLLFALACNPAIAAGPPPDDLARNPRVAEALRLVEVWLESYRTYEDIPGISAAIVHDQKILWSGGFGYADLQKKSPATPQTIYSICSISKLFTSLALMQQRDAGKLRLDDPVKQHLPWFNIRQTVPDAPPIRVGALLTHSSGLPRESDFPYWSAPGFDFPTRDRIIQRITSQETLYSPERYFQYSNLGLTLAGELVFASSGVPFSAYVKDKILNPLGMRNTTPEIPDPRQSTQLATGYGRRMPGSKRDTVPYYQVKGISPAAGFASTVQDLAQFASWQFRLLENGGTEVLNVHTLREMYRVHWVDPDWKTTWGLGFAIWRDNNKTFVGHGGSCPGYRSQLLVMPADKLATIVMANATGIDTRLLAQRMYQVVAPAVAKAIGDSKSAKPADPAVDRYTGLYRGFWGDAAVIPWEDGLAIVSLPTDNPKEALSKFKSSGEHTFSRIREDSPDLGEAVVFELGPDGRALRMTRHSNPMERIR